MLVYAVLSCLFHSLRIKNQRNHSEAYTYFPPRNNSYPNTEPHYLERYGNKNPFFIIPSSNISSRDPQSSQRETSSKQDVNNECSKTTPYQSMYSVTNTDRIESRTEGAKIDNFRETNKMPKDICVESNTKPKITICDNLVEPKQEAKSSSNWERLRKNKEMTSILKDKNAMDVKKEMTTEVLQLSKVNDAPPKDQQKLVREMRQTLGPNFATMSLIMAARTQVDVMNNLFIDPEAGETTEDPENSSNFFKEIYAPFMDALVKGNSTMSKINDHARTVPPCEQCFFCLLILVTFIYGIGIFTAVLLLASMMWYT